MNSKSKEELLREEIRASQDLLFRLIQWAITVMVSVQTALYFIRKDIVAGYVAQGLLKPGAPLPWGRHIVGTLGLIIIASIFSFMTFVGVHRYRDYKDQLIEANESGIRETPRNKFSRWSIIILYFIFPLLDILIKIYFSIEIKLD